MKYRWESSKGHARETLETSKKIEEGGAAKKRKGGFYKANKSLGERK